MKKLTVLFLVVSLFAVLYGCCSRSHDIVFVRHSDDDVVVTSRELVIDELGRLPTVTFPSGAKIEGLEENTLTPGIVVTIIEKKMTAKNTDSLINSSDSDIYLYKISAVLNPDDILEAKTNVTSFEKPFKITLPKPQNPQGIVLAGIKESDTDPWRLFNYSDSNEILANIANVRTVQDNTGENTFNLFRLGTEFALISFEGNSGNRLPETFVSSLTASSTNSILVKEGKYLEDLTVKGILKGVKLDSIKPADLRARITYRNNKLEEAPIKVNGIKVTQISLADKTVPGYTYSHSFFVYSPLESNIIGTDGDFSFKLNLKGLETQSFSSGFVIEFFNKIDSEKILPYYYTEFYRINEKEVINVSVITDDENVGPDGLYILSPTFTIKIGTELSDSDKKKIEEAVSITNIDPDKIIKKWEEGSLTIGFTEDLEPKTTYILSVDDITDIDGITITGVEDLPFTTKSLNNSYTITYDLNGGSVGIANPTSYNEASSTFVLHVPTKEGYTFIGWTGTDLDSASMTLSIPQGSIGNRSYIANWGTNTYYLTINQTTGINTVSGNGFHEFDSEVTASCTMLAGYEFDSWSGDFTSENFVMPANNATMTANARLIIYNILYNYEGGNPTGNNPDTYTIESDLINIFEPEKTGYTFNGWSGTELSGDENTDVVIEQGSIGSREYTAHWATNSYLLTLNMGIGVTSVDGDGLKEYASNVVASCTMEDGYQFDSWSGDRNTGNFVMPAEDLTMTANAKVISYDISYTWNDGALGLGENNPESYDVTSATITLKNPTKDNYDFLGWEGTGIPDGTTSLEVIIPQGSTGTRNYTAVFTQRYSITCNLNEGTLDEANPTSYNVTSEDITLNAPSRNGYDFIGWTGSNGEVPETTVTIVHGSTGNKIYNANYSAIAYTITYNLDGGTIEGYNPTGYNTGSETITLINPTKIGYNFTGWGGTDLVGNENMSVSILSGSTDNRTYTAHFTPINYTITCDLVGGAVDINNPTNYDITSATITLNNPTKDNYDFLGWEGTGIPDGTASMTVTIPNGSIDDRTYVASYTPRYTITYNLNGGTVATPNPTAYNIYTDDITLNNPSKDGHAFVGWTEGTATFPLMLGSIPQGSTDDRVFTAHFVESITFTLPGGVSLVMHKCPAGTFVMGSPSGELGRGTNEKQHNVTLSKDFYIGKFEVNQEQYKSIMGTNPAHYYKYANSPSRPVEKVNYSNAKAFCASLTTYLTGSIPYGYSKFSLPTEAQWEYACRAGTSSTLNNGTDISSSNDKCSNLDKLAWYKSNSKSNTYPGGMKAPNAWGLYDMHGNVYEWCLDWYNANYYTTSGDCSDPVGPNSGTYHVNRGGCWFSAPSVCRSANRSYNSTGYTHTQLGFRIVLVQE